MSSAHSMAGNDAAYTWWLDPTASRPNGVTTIGGRPPRPHLTSLISPQTHSFSLQLHPVSHSLLDWNSFNGHLITFLMFIVPLLQHLLHLLITVTHFTSVECLKISEQNNYWSVSKWSTRIILTSPFTPPHLTRGPGVISHLRWSTTTAHSMSARKLKFIYAQKPYFSQAVAQESSKVGGRVKREGDRKDRGREADGKNPDPRECQWQS